jgi:guanosine-3',5'-bis(diphosphate) 3'-pyrophosphohydrolase
MGGVVPTALPVQPVPPDQDKPRFLISDLCVDLEAYLAPDQIREVYRAYLFSAEAHEGQRRKSGEPYIYHPVAVARILADMRMDHKCLMAAILHDVIEDTHTAKEALAREFDEEIAELVDGVSKLTQIDFKSHAEAQAANMRKMLLAMTKDIRVILIKLADRLHNMRTLGALNPAKSRRISRETLEIYAPIANRLGINSIRLELEDLGFAHHWPWRHRCLSNAVNRARGARKELVANVETAIEERMRQEGMRGRVIGRQKHLYSIYSKMVGKKLAFKDVVDVYAFRIIVDSLDSCYRVLGVVHNLYKPVPGRFKDYIAIPKSNGYQSLHTVLFGPNGLPIEIQVRTEDMHRMAESGIAAHWVYKTQKGEVGGAQARASDWLQNLLEMQQGAGGDSMEFLENVKIDLFPDEVYVFTPKGRILVLQRGATAVDFAYAIHSDVGNSCVAARIDRRLAPLRTPLYSGQTVEIITAPGARPNPAWLNFVVTGKARANIRGHLKQLQGREAEGLGRRLLDKELTHFGLTLDGVAEDRLEKYLAAAGGVEDLHGLLRQIGLGNRLPRLVARSLAGDDSNDQRCEQSTAAGTLAILGTEGMVVNYGKCCRPIPGDPITGLFSAGKGLVVHRQGCRNLGDFQRQGHNWLEVEWDQNSEVELPTEIRVDVGNQRGVLATVAAAIAEMGSNIENVRSQERDGLSSTISFLINVRGRRHLAAIMRRLRALGPVLRIVRVSH